VFGDCAPLILQEYFSSYLSQISTLKHGLANALTALAERQKSTKTMEQALTCMRGAAEVYQQSNNTYWLPIANARIAEMKAQLVKMQR
jgi:hypothetical protein